MSSQSYNFPANVLFCLPLVDGFWNEWSAWTPCSTTCSNGTMQRTRECNGPSYGGSECHGSFKETADCFLKECPGKYMYIYTYIYLYMFISIYLIHLKKKKK